MSAFNRLHWNGRAPASALASTNVSFGKGIKPRNLRLCEPGATHISLAGNWAGMTQQLHDLGAVMASTLNDAAILNQRGRFPRFDPSAGAHLTPECRPPF